MRPQPFVDPSLAPHVPRGANPVDMVLARSANGTLGSLDQATGRWVPAVVSVDKGLINAVSASLAPMMHLVPFVNLGVGIFNGVMSWKMNKKLDALTGTVDAIALRQEIEFQKVHDSFERLDAAMHEMYREMEIKDLERLQYQVVEAGHALHSTESDDDALWLKRLGGELSAYPRPILDRLPAGAPERLPYVMARVQGLVAEADARHLRAELHRHSAAEVTYAATLRDQARDFLALEMRDALRTTSVRTLLAQPVLGPLAYWHVMQGLDTAHLLVDGGTVLEGDVVVDASGADDLRAVLAHRPTTYRMRGGALTELLEDEQGIASLMALQGVSGMPGRLAVPRAQEVVSLVTRGEQSAIGAEQAPEIARAYSGWLDLRSTCTSALDDDDVTGLPAATLDLDPDTHAVHELDWTNRIEAGMRVFEMEEPADPVAWGLALYRDASEVLASDDNRVAECGARALVWAAEQGAEDDLGDLATAAEHASTSDNPRLSILGLLALGHLALRAGDAERSVQWFGEALRSDPDGTAVASAFPARSEADRHMTVLGPAVEAARAMRPQTVPATYYRALRAHVGSTPADALECRFFEELGRIESADDSRRQDRSTKELRRHLRRAAATGSGVPAEVVAEMGTARARLVGARARTAQLSQ
ncbi:hypothetical protein [Janibacter melonis]|uniref:hypothetical protein n=1 Tax=Janibacter melonis TaxID=262209 RepID=UPI00174CA3D7|nr:hypothetical protein [Janibacter melonis]